MSPPQNLVEAAEEADLNHEFNESLVVSPPAPQPWELRQLKSRSPSGWIPRGQDMGRGWGGAGVQPRWIQGIQSGDGVGKDQETTA